MRVVRRALILLKSDARLTDLQIVEHVGCAERTVRNVRKRFCDEGLEGTLYESPRPGRPSDFTARQKQQVVALACTEPPEGRARWTLELLCQHASKRGFVVSVSKSEVSLWLKAHDLKPWRKNLVRAEFDSGISRADARDAGYHVAAQNAARREPAFNLIPPDDKRQ